MTIRPFFRRLALGAAAGLVATVAYRSIQYVSAEHAVVRAECWTWHWLPFSPAWIWPYLSMMLLMALPWFLIPDFRQVVRFGLCLLAVAATGWVIFLVHPTACLRPDPDGQPGYYVALLVLDRPDNCLPCLHSAFSVLAIWALAYSCPLLRSPASRILLGAWLILICVSIVALRQHTGVDMMAGAMLGCIGAWLWTPPQTAQSSVGQPHAGA
jgi:membrane-associated phospholipid phosphatase